MNDRHKGNEKPLYPFSAWFKRSQQVKLLEKLVTFLLVLACSYTASDAFQMALAQDRGGLFQSGILLTVLLAIGIPTVWLLSRWRGREQIGNRQTFREALYKRILSHQLEVSSVGQQEQLLGDISEQVAEQYQTRIPEMIEGISIMAGATMLMCRERLSIGLLFTAMSFLQIIPVFTYEKWTKKIYEESWDNDEAETDWIVQGVNGIRTLKAYGKESWFIHRYREINQRGVKTGNKAIATGGLEDMLYVSLEAALRYGSYIILGLYVLYGALPVESLPILVMLSGYVFSSVKQMCTFLRYRATYHMATQRLKEAIRPTSVSGERGVLQVNGVAKSFDGKQVLTDVNFVIKAKERVLLKGKNGAGKSTLIRILTGELSPDKGTVQSDMQISLALQESPLLAETAQSFLPALERQKTWDSRRFYTHLRGFHFPEELLAHPIRDLSGGEQKKLFLAITLARECDLLILDEPTNHLDEESRSYLKNVLDGLECALLICTHDPALSLSWHQTITLAGGEEDHG